MNRFIYRVIAMVVVMTAAMVAPAAANAKWSKACSDFSYDGVSVKVTDRHQFVGSMMDTYGYTTFYNHNDVPVTVYWRSYGVLKKGHKLVRTEQDKFILQPKQERKEVYSYTSARFTHRDFEYYVVAIQVERDDQPEGPTNHTVSDPASVNVVALTSKYDDGKKLTQRDYAEAIAWLNLFYDEVFYPAYDLKLKTDLNDAKNRFAFDERYRRDIAPFEGMQWQLGNIVNLAYDEGKLDSTNEKAWKAFYKRQKSYVTANSDIISNVKTGRYDFTKYIQEAEQNK